MCWHITAWQIRGHQGMNSIAWTANLFYEWLKAQTQTLQLTTHNNSQLTTTHNEIELTII